MKGTSELKIYMPQVKALVIIQARLGSTRLPEKLFYDLAGYKLIDHVIHRALKIDPFFKVVIATTSSSEDDKLENYCSSKFPVLLTRGSEKNVFNRFKQAIEEHATDEQYLIRITSDDPLRDASLSKKALNILSNSKVAVAIVNRGKLNFPLGVETEICSLHHFMNISLQERNDYIDEHVFPFYRSMNENLCLAIQPKNDLAKYALTVDTKEDLATIDKIMLQTAARLSKSSLEVTWQEVLNVNE